jgi:gluconate 5-dehydrogenase
MSTKLFDLSGKNVLVTGSGQGLGLAIGTGLAEAGARLILSDINTELVAQRVGELEARGLKCASGNFNVTEEQAVSEGIDKIERDIGPIDILVNNAGMQRRGPLEEISEEDWKAVIDLNLTAVWRVSKFAVRGMIERKSGKIINIASLMAWGGRPTTGPYTASKGGVLLLTKAMTVEWAEHNVQVNAIGPGYFLTEMTQKLADDPKFDGWVKMRTPARRWGDPKELIGAAIYLSSEASSFVTGQIIYVDGGWVSNL